jgi:protein ImuB
MIRSGGCSAPPEVPFALVAAGEKGVTLTAVNAAAAREGLGPGLGLADARARCPHLRSAEAEPENDGRALLKLARWCGRYSPSLNRDGAQGLWIDVTGAAHLFGGEASLCGDLEARLARLGFTARLGLADTLGAAWALARFASETDAAIAASGETSNRLSGLAIEGLRLAPETLTLLKRLGLRRIGELRRLPRISLQRRFSSRELAQAVLTRLDQALGKRKEPRAPLTPPPRYLARAAFPEPLISSAGVEAALARLTQDLCGRLARELQGARQITFTAYRLDGSFAEVRAGLSAPSRTADHMVRLLGEKIQAIDAGFGIDCLTLAASAAETLPPEQGVFVTQGARAAPGRLIDRLSNRLGAPCVFSLEPRASHVPERAEQRRNDAGAPDTPWAAELVPKPPRPLFLFARPEPIAVVAEIPEGPPARFTWRRVMRRIVRADGPERIAPEWWRAIGRSSPKHSRPRDYYRIEDEAGGRYWVFREGLYQAQALTGVPQWYLHGLF